MKNRRKLSNLVIDPAALWRLSVPFLLLLVCSLAGIYLTCYQIISVIEQVSLPEVEGLQFQTFLSQVIFRTSMVAMVSMFIISVLTLIMWIFYSHRLLGPVVPLRRHIEKLSEGDYTAQTHLRKGDELQVLAEKLNRLSEALQKRTYENK